jgi:hypothetical protein
MTRLRTLLLLAPVLLAASDAHAVQLPAQVVFGFQIPTLPSFDVQAGGAVFANPNGGGVHLASLAIPSAFGASSTVIPVTDPGVSPIRGLQITADNGFGFFAETPSGTLRGTMPLRGVTKVCLFGPCSNAVANIVVPLVVVGSGGSTAVSAAVNVTVRGAPWTTGTAAIGSITQVGSRGVPSATAQLGGMVNMVTPIFISTNIGSIPTIDAYGRLQVFFEGPGFCDVEVDRAAYQDGDTIVITRLRYANGRDVSRSYRMRLYVTVPVGDITAEILDQVVTFPRHFDRDIGPIAAIPVGPEQPRGEYKLGCWLLDMSTDQLHVDEASFTLE